MPGTDPHTRRLRDSALEIWYAGVEAVRSERLVRACLRRDGSTLWIDDESLDLTSVEKIAVVGAGKAGAGMADAVEQILGDSWLAEKQLAGWVNVPADCLRPLKRIQLHAARPAGVNEPTAEGVAGAKRILELVASLGPNDLCLALISGGGSALLPAPADGVTLGDKLAVTTYLSAAGADIGQLNTVRKQLSRIKGGGLARACRAGRLVTLIISDVIGDPLDIIASGPTVADRSTPEQALAVLEQFGATAAGVAPAAVAYLEQKRGTPPPPPVHVRLTNVVIGNNATAVEAARVEAARRGLTTHAMHAVQLEGAAEGVGQQLAERALQLQQASGCDCLISGGEPTVQLVDASLRGLGGRNQQLALAALIRLGDTDGIALVSGGTDGEDGPTDAAGAVADAAVAMGARRLGLDAMDHLKRNDAYHFFEPLDALIRTGPTHTNVCDLRVVVRKRSRP